MNPTGIRTVISNNWMSADNDAGPSKFEEKCDT